MRKRNKKHGRATIKDLIEMLFVVCLIIWSCTHPDEFDFEYVCNCIIIYILKHESIQE